MSLLAFTALTAALLGPETYWAYYHEALPSGERFYSGWPNASLVGWWFKSFDPATKLEHVEPLWRSPLLARAGALCSNLVVVFVLGRLVGRARTARECDHAFGLSVTAMLLVSPITWEHYLIQLLVPVAVLAVSMQPSRMERGLFLLVLIAFWLDTTLLHAFIPGGRYEGMAYPWQTLTVLSFQCYALVGLFILGVVDLHQQQRRPAAMAAQA